MSDARSMPAAWSPPGRWLTVLMFAFGFCPGASLYDDVPRPGDQRQDRGAYGGEQQVDVGREVKVQSHDLEQYRHGLGVSPAGDQLVVSRRGEPDGVLRAQPERQANDRAGYPSIAPVEAAAYFHKTECFCFTQQVLQPGESIRDAGALHRRPRSAQGCAVRDAGFTPSSISLRGSRPYRLAGR